VNATDENGNKIALLVEVNQDGTADITRSGFKIFVASALIPSGEEVFIFAGLVVIFGIAVILDGDEKTATTYTGAAEVYENIEVASSVKQFIDNAELPIRLPGGVVRPENDPAIGDQIHRGYGWEYIEKRAPGITKHEIGEVLRAPGGVYNNGDKTLVIGDNPDTQYDIIIRLEGATVEGTINGQLIEDPQGTNVVVDRTDRHPVRDDDVHPDSYNKIVDAIQNPDEIWEKGIFRSYVKEINGRWLVVRTRFNGHVHTVGTAAYEGSNYNAVENYLNDKDYDIPGDRV